MVLKDRFLGHPTWAMVSVPLSVLAIVGCGMGARSQSDGSSSFRPSSINLSSREGILWRPIPTFLGASFSFTRSVALHGWSSFCSRTRTQYRRAWESSNWTRGGRPASLSRKLVQVNLESPVMRCAIWWYVGAKRSSTILVPSHHASAPYSWVGSMVVVAM